MTHESQNSLARDPNKRANHRVNPSINLLKLRHIAKNQKKTQNSEQIEPEKPKSGFTLKLVDQTGKGGH